MCPEEETVAAFVAGQLAAGERDAFEAHVDGCADCQALVAALARLATPRAAASSGDDGAPATALGDQLGRYALLSRLGAGGMGVVYAAYDPVLDRRVALKLLRHDADDARLRAEARAIARLAHPNVVAVHDVGRVGDEAFVAMEYVDGVTIAGWLATPRAVAEILAVFVDAGCGLAAAHRAGLVHRDVTPRNIMVGADGRVRVLDFGLAQRDATAADEVVGTPGYMAPEQARGAAVDARADQFAFCVALWEALAGTRPRADERGGIAGAPERVVRALRRGLATAPDARFATLDALLAELVPRSRSRRWLIAPIVGIAGLGGALAYALAAGGEAPRCARAGAAIDAVWGEPPRAALRSGFAATHLPYAAVAADALIRDLDGWTARWRAGAEATCRATLIDRTQPAAAGARRDGCLAELLEGLRPLVAISTHPDAEAVAHAGALVDGLPAPERCADVAGLDAVTPPAERDRAAVAAVRAELAAAEAELLEGRVGADADAIVGRAAAVAYLPLQARGLQLRAALASHAARYDDAIATLHAAARAATASRDLERLAAIWIELAQLLGNDLRTADAAAVFDGYAEALIAVLPDRDGLHLQLTFARCNRNGRPADAAALAAQCQAVIDLAAVARPRLAVASRTRLGHFQGLGGHHAQALATLTTAVADAVRSLGADHPDTAVARYARGIALLAVERVDDGVAELRAALAIRRAAFPAGDLRVAESLQGLGDALGSKGDHAGAIAALTEALALLDALHQAESAQAANAQLLIAMSLEEVHRDEDAIVHELRAADIADRSLPHREDLAAMGLRMAADAEARHGRAAEGVLHLERALRLLERGKAEPADVGKTQLRLVEVRVAQGELGAARAMADAARATLRAAGAAGAEDLAALDLLTRQHRWR